MINWNTAWGKMWIHSPRRLNQPLHLKETHTQGVHVPVSAKEAWQQVLKHWNEGVLGSCKALTSIESAGTLFDNGRGTHWHFEVDLLDQSAKATINWSLIWDGVSQKWVATHIEVTAAPYPAIGSPIHRVVALGHGSTRLLEGAWKQMREQSIDISDHFIDTPHVFQQMHIMGKTLKSSHIQAWTGMYGGEKYWVVKDAENTHFMPLEVQQGHLTDVRTPHKEPQEV